MGKKEAQGGRYEGVMRESQPSNDRSKEVSGIDLVTKESAESACPRCPVSLAVFVAIVTIHIALNG